MIKKILLLVMLLSQNLLALSPPISKKPIPLVQSVKVTLHTTDVSVLSRIKRHNYTVHASLFFKAVYPLEMEFLTKVHADRFWKVYVTDLNNNLILEESPIITNPTIQVTHRLRLTYNREYTYKTNLDTTKLRSGIYLVWAETLGYPSIKTNTLLEVR
jgi:hypothetical protein